MSPHRILAGVFAGFLVIAARIAAAAAVSLLARGTPLSGMWDSKESSSREPLRHRLVFGAGFILLAARFVLRRGRLDRWQVVGMGSGSRETPPSSAPGGPRRLSSARPWPS